METIDTVSDLQQANVGSNNPKQIVHVRGDSETELDLLFSVLNSREQKPPIRSFREMNLPPSFFRPPDPKPAGYHSREGSLDGVSAANQLVAGNIRQPGAGNVNVFHSRSHSSPAQLPLASLSVAPPPNHLKQGSADASGALQTVDQQLHRQSGGWPVPPGNNQPQNNNKYFMSNTNNVWPQDVRVGAVNSPNKPSTGVLGPLPAGWEQGVTAEGDIYYINHIEKTTSWFDPRLPKNVQKSVPVKATVGRNASRLTSAHSSVPVSNEQLIQIELQKLLKEKERLQREQEDNNRKEQMLLNELAKLKTSSHGMNESLLNTGLHQMVSTGVDPFLGQTTPVVNNNHSIHDSHARQNSNESGHKTSSDLSQLQSSTCMTILGVDTSEPLAMDSDDLVSSFTGELGMDVQMMENIIQYI